MIEKFERDRWGDLTGKTGKIRLAIQYSDGEIVGTNELFDLFLSFENRISELEKCLKQDSPKRNSKFLEFIKMDIRKIF